MDIFDQTIIEIREWFRRKIEEGGARQYYAPTGLQPPPREDPSIILREDTHLELGHPSLGSCSETLATHEPSLVANGRITLVGPEISEAREKFLPFAQIAVACCTGDIPETAASMDRLLHIHAQTEGYMLRSVPQRIWARVGTQAVRSGFSMRQLGQRLIASLAQEDAGITASEIFFVTGSREDVSALEEITEAARQSARKLRSFARESDGSYECASSLDCAECPEKPVCDTIREVITIRKGDRIITLGERAAGNGGE